MSKRSWAILAVSLLLSPGCMVVQLGVTNPIPELSTVAIAPFLNLSQEPNMVVDGRRFAMAYQSELQKIPGFEVIPVGITEQTIIDLQLQLNDTSDLRKLAKELNADIIVIGAITDYDPYYPTRLGMTIEWFANEAACQLNNVPLDPHARGDIIKSDLLFRKELFKAKWERRYHRVKDAIETRPLEQMKIEGIEHPVEIQPQEFREVPNLFRGQSPAYPVNSVRIQTGTNRPTSWKSNTGLELWPNSSGSASLRQPVSMQHPRPIPQPARSEVPERNQFPYGYSNYRINSRSQKKTTSFEKIQNPITGSAPGRFKIISPAKLNLRRDILISQQQPAPEKPAPELPQPTLPEDALLQKTKPTEMRNPPLPSEMSIPSPQSQPLPAEIMPDHSMQVVDAVKFGRLMTYTRMFDSSESDLLAEWRDYLELSGDQRYGDWVARLNWSENFIRFTARLMIREMLIIHGGEAKRRIAFKLRKHR